MTNVSSEPTVSEPSDEEATATGAQASPAAEAAGDKAAGKAADKATDKATDKAADKAKAADGARAGEPGDGERPAGTDGTDVDPFGKAGVHDADDDRIGDTDAGGAETGGAAASGNGKAGRAVHDGRADSFGKAGVHEARDGETSAADDSDASGNGRHSKADANGSEAPTDASSNDTTADESKTADESSDGKTADESSDSKTADESGDSKTADVDGDGKAASSADGDGTDSADAVKAAGEKEGEADKDPFAAFAPPVEAAPGRAKRVSARVAGAIGRFLAHEWTLAAIGSVLLAAVMTWPTLRDPATTIPQDIWDPTLQAWQMSWAGHVLTTDPAQLWNANAFFPNQYSYAFSDTLLGYAPAGMIGDGPVAAIVRYNIIFVLIFALAFFGAYALARQLGSSPTGAAVAGAAFAYAPWRLGQAGHLHVLSIGGIALALAMLARGHGFSLSRGYEPDKRRWGWVVAGWLVAAWQISLGFGIGIPFAYTLLGIVLVTALIWGYRHTRVWTVRRPFGWKLLLANFGGGLAFAATGALMAYPYLQVLKAHPYARRSEEIVGLFSPPLQGFFISPPESYLWGDAYAAARQSLPWAPEMALLPGFFLYGLAFAGLFVSTWRIRHRVFLGLGVVVSVLLAMGTHGPGKGEFGYLALYRALPGFDGIRTPGRLMVWTTLFLALLAAGAISAFAQRAVELFADRTQSDVTTRAGFWPRLATLVPLVLVLAEGVHKEGPQPVVPPAPVAFSTLQAPLMVLPTDELTDMNIMLWSTDGFPKMVNGGSGFTPRDQEQMRLTMQQFPDEASVQALRDLNIRTVVVVRSRALGTSYERAIDAPIDGLGLERTEQGDVVLYKVGEATN